MACRIAAQAFIRMAHEEAEGFELVRVGILDKKPDDRDIFNLASVERDSALLNRKAIQSLVDEPEQARPIIRNLLRWAKENGAQ